MRGVTGFRGYGDSDPRRQDRSWSLYGPRSRGRTGRMGSRRLLQAPRAHECRRLMAVTFAEPLAVVALLEVEQGQAQLLHGVEGPEPQQLFLERPDEPLGHPVAFGLPHERRARRDPQEGQLRLEVVAHVLAAVIVPRQQ